MTFRGLTKPLAVIDTEWTDGSPATARIVAVGIERHDPDGTTTSGHWLVDPEAPISAESTAVHGIRDEDVADRPTFREVAAEIAAMLAGCDLGGYGIRGDLQILELAMQEAGVAWSPTGAAIIDGLRMWQVLEPRRLTDAHERFVGPVPEDGNAHEAGFDARLTAAVIAALRNDRSMDEIHAETNADMVDVAGKFRLDQGRRVVFGFGPYRGAPALEEPEFLEWMLRKDFAPSTRDVAQALLDEYWAETHEAGDHGDGESGEATEPPPAEGGDGEPDPCDIPF